MSRCRPFIFVGFFLFCSLLIPSVLSAHALPWTEYSVKCGETMASIAEGHGLSQKTLRRANEMTAREDCLEPGEKLLIPKNDSDLFATLAEHRARARGETIAPAVRQEKTLSLADLTPKKKPAAQIRADGLEPLIRPLAGRVTSPFGKRGGRLHDGIDIPAPAGTAIVAARSGRVIFSGVIRGFGNTVTLDHGGGFVTRYSHNSANLVKKGAWVRRGEPVAKVGRTGRSTCNHLHFSILINGRAVNPEQYLPRN